MLNTNALELVNWHLPEAHVLQVGPDHPFWQEQAPVVGLQVPNWHWHGKQFGP
jgi:hypothetical protein